MVTDDEDTQSVRHVPFKRIRRTLPLLYEEDYTQTRLDRRYEEIRSLRKRHVWRLKDTSSETVDENLAKFMVGCGPKKQENTIHLCAGSGSITKFIKAQEVSAVEKDESRIAAGKEVTSNVDWIQGNVLSKGFLKSFTKTESCKYDCVYSRPTKDEANAVIAVGSEIIRGNINGRLVYLLPSLHFDKTKTTVKLLKRLKVDIVREFKIGTSWSGVGSYKNGKPYSIFVMRRSLKPKLDYKTKVVWFSDKKTPVSK